jgi:glycosyltransferase involved in cell wall biosynthesis
MPAWRTPNETYLHLDGNAMMIFWTKAYNAEKTISRAVDSILNQTRGDFTYILLDNGSTDSTGEIIREYAAKDSRIVPLKREENLQAALHEYLPLILSYGSDGYFSLLDADDEYKPDFLEKMLAFVTDNNLDIALCGTEYVEQDGHSRLDTPARTLIFEGTGFAEHFTAYYKYTTRLWAALYSLRILPQLGYREPERKGKEKREANFGDSMGALRMLRFAARAGLLAESLHKYYMSSAQLSSAYTPKWFWWINTLQDQVRQYLLEFGPISKENEDFLRIRFLIWLKYIMPRIQKADVSLEWKLKDLCEIFSDGRTKALLSLRWSDAGIYSDKKTFLREVWEWVQTQDENGQLFLTQELVQMLQAYMEVA